MQRLLRLAAAFCLFPRASPRKVQQLRLQAQVRFPEFAVVHILNLFPGFGFSAVALPSNSEVTIVKSTHLRRQP